MTDNMSKANRSYTMAQIRAKGNTSTELKMIQLMRCNGIKGWRRNQNVLGKPDFIFWKKRVAIFIDGCFWHGCRKCLLKPKSNVEYWEQKIKRNRERDREVTKYLTKDGWIVIRFWEHSLNRPTWVLSRLHEVLNKLDLSPEKK